ncbi:polycystin-1-like [Glandiceps talaboti]
MVSVHSLLLLITGLLGLRVHAEHQLCSNNTVSVGSIVERTNIASSTNRLIIFESSPFRCYGTLTGLKFWSIQSASFKVGVWKKLQLGYYYLVKEEEIVVVSNGNQTVELTNGISFSDGDVLGVRWLTPTIGYDTGSDAQMTYYSYITSNEYATDWDHGAVRLVSGNFTGSYSIEAVINNELSCPVDEYGSEVIDRANLDNASYAMVLAGLPMPCSGRVTGWTFFSPTTSDFTLAMYRPVSGTADSYKLVGETHISGDHHTTVETVVYLNDDEQFEFLPGDVIGFRFESGTLVYDSESEDSVLVKWFDVTNNTDFNVGIGDTLTFCNGSEYRTYSVKVSLASYDYRGCYREDSANREFLEAAGRYDSRLLTPGVCIELCGEQGFNYGALQQGELCFCADSYGSHGDGDQSECDYSCAGDYDMRCGGILHNDVYKTAESLNGFHLVPIEGKLSTYDNISIITNISRGNDVIYTYDVSDGNSIGPTDENVVYYNFRKPGKFSVLAEGVDEWSNVATDTLTIKVETQIGNIVFLCPDSHEANSAFTCDIKIEQGTNMSALVNFSDGRIVDMQVADAEGVWYGLLDDPDTSLNYQPLNSVYLLVNQRIREDGKLVGWEFNALEKGNVYLQIYRPSCPGQQFCYRSYSCISTASNCSEQVSVWSKSCNAVGRYSFTQRKCIHATNGSLVDDFVFSAQPVDYEFVTEFQYTVEKLGLQYIPVNSTEQFTVLQGDVAAWYNSGEGKIGYTTTDLSKDGPEFLASTSGHDHRHTSGFVAEVVGSSTHTYKHALRAHVVRPSVMRLVHNYTEDTARRDIIVNVTNDVSSFIATHTMKIQIVIKDLVFDNPPLGKTDEELHLYIPEHIGSEVNYHWYFGDGGENVTTFRCFNYTWKQPGFYRISLFASNDISDAYYESWITIQDIVSDLTWGVSDPISPYLEYPITPKAIDSETVLNWTISRGTNVTYEVDLVDGIVPVFYLVHDDDPLQVPVSVTALHNGLSGSVRYTYPSIGYYNVSVNASNLVSWQIIYSMAIVQIPVSNFSLFNPGPITHGMETLVSMVVDSGSNVTFIGSFNDVLLENNDFQLDEESGEGFLVLKPGMFTDRGNLTLTATGWNLISVNNYTLNVHVEYNVTDLKIWVDDVDVTPDTNVTVKFDMEQGSGLSLMLDFDDGLNVTYTEGVMFRSNGQYKQMVHYWSYAKDFNVTITAENILGMWKAYIIEYVQNPVRNITVATNSPGVIPKLDNGTIEYNLTYSGDMATPPTAASVHYAIDTGINMYRDFPVDTTGQSTFVHNLTLGSYGTYYTVITISNRVSSMIFHETIEMEEPVEDLVITTSPSPPYIKVGESLTATIGFSWGSRVSFFWYFQDNYQDGFMIGQGGSLTQTHAYNESGSYQLNVTTENLLGQKTAYADIKVQYPVQGFVVRGRRLNKLQKLEVGYVTVPFDLYISKAVPAYEFPTEALCNIDFGESQNYNVTLSMSNADISRDTDSEYHVWRFPSIYYTTAGHYEVTFFIWNLVSNGTYTFDVYIYESISDLENVIKYNEYILDNQDTTGNESLDASPVTFGEDVYLPVEEAVVFIATFASGTSLTYDWDFGDEHSMCPVTQPPPTGTTTPQATTKTVPINATTSTASYNFTTTITGNYTTIQPTTVQMEPCDPILTTTEPRAIWWFTHPGVYTVTVNVSNPVDWEMKVKVVHIEARAEGLYLSDHGPGPVNTSLNFELNTGNVGTDACYYVNFQDTTSEINHIAFWGEEETCKVRYASHFNTSINSISGTSPFDNLRFFNVSSSSLLALKEIGQDPNITIHNHFMTISEYTIQVIAFNHLSEEIVYMSTSVTKGPCYYPAVVVQDENYCNDNYILCDDATGYRQYLASADLRVYSSVKLNCTTTNRAWFTWRAFKQQDNGTEIEVDLGSTVVFGAPLKTLTVSALTLDYGLYRFELNVSMDGEFGVESFDSAFIYVEATPLRAVISGGSERRIRWNSIVELDGLTETIDPDIDPTDKTGLQFMWMCRRKTYKRDALTEDDYIENVESFEVWNDDYTVLLAPANESAEFEAIKSSNSLDEGGCFGRYGDDDSGPGSKINYTTGQIYIDTKGMYWDMEYELKVIVMKGDRIDVAYQVLDVSEGDPPRMSIACKVNCLDKASTTSRFSLESHDEDWVRGLVLYYKWELQDIQGRKYRTIASSEWLPYSGTGNDGMNFSLERGYFLDVTNYRVKVIVSRNEDFANYGMASYELFTNEVPEVGTCYADPNNGTALNTTFNIHCSGWDDPNRPLTYRFAIRSNSTEDWNWIYSGEKTYMEQGCFFPEGLEENDYNVSILVRVEDSYGTYSDLEGLQVQVLPLEFDETETTNLIKSFTSDDDSMMKQMIGNGDSGTAVNIASACAKTLNKASTLSKLGTSSNSSSVTVVPTSSSSITSSISTGIYTTQSTLLTDDAEITRAENTQLRASLAEGISSGSVTTMGELKHFTSALVTVTYDPYELSEDAQDIVLATSETWVSFLGEKTTEGRTMADYLEDAGSGLLAVVSNSLAASKATVQQYHAAAEALQTDLDVLVTTAAPDDSSSSAKRRRRRDLEQAIEDANIAEEQAHERATKAMSLTRSVTDTVQNTMVAGQTDVSVAGNGISIRVGMTFTENMENKQYDQGNGVTIELPNTQTMFGDDNITFIGQKVITYDDNFITWTNNSNNVQGTLLSMDLTNDTGEPIDLKDLANPIEVWLTRDETHVDLNVEWQYNVTTPFGDDMTIHLITLDEPAALVVEVRPLDVNGTNTENVTFFLYFGVDMYPSDDVGEHDFNCTIPRLPQYEMGDNGTLYVSNQWELEEPYLWTCFFSNVLLESYMNTTADIYVGVKHTGGWNETAADTYLAGSDYVNFWPMNYQLRDYTLQCKYFDFDDDVWKQDGMEVGSRSTQTDTQCFARHLTLFGGGFQLPINRVDFRDSAFTKLHENPVVFAFMVSCIGVYLAVIVWARKADKRDLIKVGATPLKDNDPRDQYFYEITIFTGVRNNASTSAKVSIIMTGDKAETEPRPLVDDKRKIFERGSVDSFIMAVPEPLGNLIHVRLWHDNGGKYPSWFLNRVSVKDLQTDNMFYFMLDRWLAVEEDDGQIERVIPVAGKSELTSFGHLFYSKTRRNLSDGHLWFSVFIRPPRSKFTRVQRATCCVSLLFCTMMANIFFYNVDITGGAGGTSYSLGPINFSLAELCIGVISSLMVFPVNLIVVQIFRTVREHPQVNCCCCCRRKETGDPASSYVRTSMSAKTECGPGAAKAKSELEHQLQMLDVEEEDQFLKENKPRPESMASHTSRPISRISTISYSGVSVNMEGASEYMKKPVAGYKKIRKKKKKCELPWGFVYVAWFLAGASMAVAFVMTIEVAGQFGKEKSTEWLKSMAFSLIQDILISQPIKVLFLAVFYALVIKTPDKAEEDEDSPHLDKDEEWVHERMTVDELNNPEKMAELQREKALRMSSLRLPDTDELETARQIRFKEIRMHGILKEIVFYVMFLYLLMIICYGNRDPAGYLFSNSLMDQFVNAGYNGKMKYQSISTRDYFWNYTENVLIPSFFTSDWYNGERDKYGANTGMIADRSSVLVGVAQFRQARVKTENCSIREEFQSVIDRCRMEYSYSNELSDNMLEGWEAIANGTEEPNYRNKYMSVWEHKNWYSIDSYPYYTKHATYSGGGYVATLGNDYDAAIDMASYLRANNWVDQFTRAVFIEFVVFNPSSNLFAVSYLIMEFLPTGGAFPYTKFHIMPLDRYYGTWMYFVMAAEVLYTLCILYFVYREMKLVMKFKKKYFKSFWNLFEVVCLSLAITAIVMYFLRLVVSWNVVKKYKEDRNAFTNFQYLSYWDELYGYMVSVLLFLCTIKFIKLLRFNRRMLLLSETIRICWYDMFLFLIIFGIMFFCFAHFAFLIFGISLKDFSTIVLTIESLFSTLLGKFEFEDMVMASRYLGPIFFFHYVIIVMFVMLNMFLSIINEGFSRAKANNDRLKNELEIVDFMIDRFKKWTGFSEKRIQNSVKAYQYLEGADKGDVECDELRDKLSEMVDRLNELVRAEKRENKDILEDVDDDKPRQIFTS